MNNPRQQQQQSHSHNNNNNNHQDGGTTNNRGRSNRNRKSKSPKRQQNNKAANSRSPKRNQQNKSKSPMRNRGQQQQQQQQQRKKKPSAMTVIVNRCDLWDSAAHFQPEECFQAQIQHTVAKVLPYKFEPPLPSSGMAPPLGMDNNNKLVLSVATARVPHRVESIEFPIRNNPNQCDVIDTTIPNPHDPDVVHDKYWAQRRRLFARFDRGIQLDAEGWYSVTPEIIADHVAKRVSSLVETSLTFEPQLSSGQGVVILDGFCGCGGNAIAFGKIPSNIVSKIVCVDTDRSKLLKAAHNASLYDIPKDKLVFVQCNSIFILKYCYRNGEFILDQPQATMPQYMPPPVIPTVHAGFQVGGFELLPRRIDLAFFDPPWGGIDYEILGKNGYDLERNMKIQVDSVVVEEVVEEEEEDCGISDDFFDTFAAAPKPKASKKTRKKNFNQKTEGEFVNGKELVKLAAEAVRSKVVLLDLPRNTSKTSLGTCALAAGYRGNLKLEEHYLNGRLKTVTAYLGSDYSALINESDAVEH